MARPSQAFLRAVTVAAIAGCMLRIAFAFGYWTGKPLTHDEREYLALASSLASGRGFAYDDSIEVGTGQLFGRAPGYPFFLFLIGAGSTDPANAPLRVQGAQAAVGALGVLIIAFVARRAAGERAGAVAAAIAAVHPPLVTMPAYVLSETLFSTLALGTALLFQRAIDREHGPRPIDMLSTGVAVGVTALVRPAMVFFLPLAVLWLCWRRRPVPAIALAAAALLTILPWTIRNAGVYGRLVPIATEGGITFWTGNHPLAIGEGDLAANPDLKRAELAFREAHPGLPPAEMESLYYRDALASIRAHPVRWLGLLARKAFYLVVPMGPSYGLHSIRYRAASTAPYLLLLPFAAAGVPRLLRSPRRPVALGLLAGSAVLVCLIFFPQERFRIPVIDPALIVCASALATRADRRAM